MNTTPDITALALAAHAAGDAAAKSAHAADAAARAVSATVALAGLAGRPAVDFPPLDHIPAVHIAGAAEVLQCDRLRYGFADALHSVVTAAEDLRWWWDDSGRPDPVAPVDHGRAIRTILRRIKALGDSANTFEKALAAMAARRSAGPTASTPAPEPANPGAQATAGARPADEPLQEGDL